MAKTDLVLTRFHFRAPPRTVWVIPVAIPGTPSVLPAVRAGELEPQSPLVCVPSPPVPMGEGQFAIQVASVDYTASSRPWDGCLGPAVWGVHRQTLPLSRVLWPTAFGMRPCCCRYFQDTIPRAGFLRETAHLTSWHLWMTRSGFRLWRAIQTWINPRLTRRLRASPTSQLGLMSGPSADSLATSPKVC